MLPPGARPWRASCPAFNSCWDPGMQPLEPQVQIMPAPWKQQSQHLPSQPGPGPQWPMRQGARSPPCALHRPTSSLLPFVQHDPCPVLGADLTLTVSWCCGVCHVSLTDCGLPEVGASQEQITGMFKERRAGRGQPTMRDKGQEWATRRVCQEDHQAEGLWHSGPACHLSPSPPWGPVGS